MSKIHIEPIIIMNINDFLKSQIEYTTSSTRKKFIELSKLYNDKLSINFITSKFDPKNDMKKITIDGLNSRYIKNNISKLTLKTHILLKLCNNINIKY